MNEHEPLNYEPVVLDFKPPTPTVDRVVIVGHVTHLRMDRESQYVDFAYERLLKSKSEYYDRLEFKVGQEWKPLDFGWIQDVGVVCIVNRKTEFMRVPSKEEREEADAKVVEISFASDAWRTSQVDVILYPGQPIQFSPAHREIRLRCRSGIAECRVTVLPD
jgi:hypothetical protein